MLTVPKGNGKVTHRPEDRAAPQGRFAAAVQAKTKSEESQQFVHRVKSHDLPQVRRGTVEVRIVLEGFRG